jgi:hypothetical protein
MTAPQQQKLKIAGPSVVTANRLDDGAVIYRAVDGSWSADLQAARIVATASDAVELLGEALADGQRAVGAYVAPVRVGSNTHLSPANLRERIRLGGPTVSPPGTPGKAKRHVRL